MTAAQAAEPRSRFPLAVRAIVTGLLVGLVGANIWEVFLVTLGIPTAMLAETAFLALYIWWVSGGGAPLSNRASRRLAFRAGALSRAQWTWGIVAALCFAICVHATLVVLFRLIAFPVNAFRQGYDFAAGTNLTLRWLAITISAVSAGVCEETGFRGYMQQPIEKRHGAFVAILVSATFFTLAHLNQGWVIPQILPVIFGAGVLLGLTAWASGSLLPGILGHTIMDVGLFAYWWTNTLGTFSAKPIWVTGIDLPTGIAVAVAGAALGFTLFAIARLRALRDERSSATKANLPGSGASVSP